MTDFSFEAHAIQATICEEAAIIRAELTRPSVLFKPRLSLDGDQWCALLGDNLQEGFAAFGDTPDEAMCNFDKGWSDK